MSKNEGLRIDHDFEELEKGVSYIMIPKDTPLIDPITNTLVEGRTELVNAELEQNNKMNKGRLDDPYMNAMEEELKEFDNKQKVLFYFIVKVGIELDERGQYDPNKSAQLAAIKEKLMKPKANMVSLETRKVVASEYEEPVKIKKKVGTLMLKRRKIEPDIEDVLEEEADGDENDLKTKEAIRKEQQIKENEAELKNQAERSVNYGRAIKKAKKLTADAFQPKDEYDEIEEAMNRQRRAMMNAANSNTKRGGEEICEIIAQETPLEQDNSKPEDGVVISDLNFIKAIPSNKQRREYQEKVVRNTQFSLKDAKSGATSVVNVPLPTEVLGYLTPGYSSCVPSSYQPSAKPEAIPEGPKEEGEVKPAVKSLTPLEEGALDELLIGKGVGNVIKLLRDRKLLGQALYIGRSKDSTREKELEKFGRTGNKEEDKIDLDHRDASGYKLSIKEQWREQGRKFHGIPQSKKKLEKIMEKRRKEKNKLTSDQNKYSKTGQALAKTQQEKGVPYMILDAKRPIIF